jgi:hypothetical protein
MRLKKSQCIFLLESFRKIRIILINVLRVSILGKNSVCTLSSDSFDLPADAWRHFVISEVGDGIEAYFILKNATLARRKIAVSQVAMSAFTNPAAALAHQNSICYPT